MILGSLDNSAKVIWFMIKELFIKELFIFQITLMEKQTLPNLTEHIKEQFNQVNKEQNNGMEWLGDSS